MKRIQRIKWKPSEKEKRKYWFSFLYLPMTLFSILLKFVIIHMILERSTRNSVLFIVRESWHAMTFFFLLIFYETFFSFFFVNLLPYLLSWVNYYINSYITQIPLSINLSEQKPIKMDLFSHDTYIWSYAEEKKQYFNRSGVNRTLLYS